MRCWLRIGLWLAVFSTAAHQVRSYSTTQNPPFHHDVPMGTIPRRSHEATWTTAASIRSARRPEESHTDILVASHIVAGTISLSSSSAAPTAAEDQAVSENAGKGSAFALHLQISQCTRTCDEHRQDACKDVLLRLKHGQCKLLMAMVGSMENYIVEHEMTTRSLFLRKYQIKLNFPYVAVYSYIENYSAQD
ncbi:hypothetical protein EVG20_g1503 [Dentipellis fragilis]|uniref:Apple domain-containing protein n=1 Tax=Dentipellis fragilis TaxID=205917 RepID=A0A4Y9ZAE9_9AGAM|nr:hypothetical protein EVG20_g1503 [Dentipellis fragilis]